MSTKKTREALELLRTYARPGGTVDARVDAALAELEAIEKAATCLLTPQSPKEKAWALLATIKRESQS